jgi:hypothetical protein
MPYYRITITMNNSKKLAGIKENATGDIDFMFQHYYRLACQRLGQENIIDFDCVLVSQHSNVFKAWKGTEKKVKGPRRYGWKQ